MLPETFKGFAIDEIGLNQNDLSVHGEEQCIYVNPETGFLWYLCCYPLPLSDGELLDAILKDEFRFFDLPNGEQFIIAVQAERLSPPYLSNLEEFAPDLWAHWWAWKMGFEKSPESLCGEPCPYATRCDNCESYWERLEAEGYIKNGVYTRKWYKEQAECRREGLAC